MTDTARVDKPGGAQTTGSRTFTLNMESLQLNVGYWRTVPGILKVVEWVLAIICMCCVAPALFGGASFFLFVVVLCFIGTFIWACIHFFSITSVINASLLLHELVYTSVSTLLYFIAMIVLYSQTTGNYYYHFQWGYMGYFGSRGAYNAYLAGATFGLFNTIAYGVETFWHGKKYMEFRRALTQN